MTEWPQVKINQLTKLWNTGTTAKQIAEALGTTVNNIGRMVRICRDRGIDLTIRYKKSSTPLALRGSEVELRPCLGWCGKEFHSVWKGNRFCPACDTQRKRAA